MVRMMSLLIGAADPSTLRALIDVGIILAVAGVVAVVMQRVRLEVVPAYLIAGALIGPGAIGLVSSPDRLASISNIAIILLMFGIGLHMETGLLRRGVGAMIATGVVSTLLSIAVGVPVAMAFGIGAPGAVAIAMALSLSSTAVVMRILTERRQINRPTGHLSFGILIVQDLIVIAMLASMPGLARWGAGGEASAETQEAGLSLFLAIGQDIALKAGAVALIIVLGMRVLPKLLHEAAKAPSREVLVVISTAAAIGAAVATQAVGFSAELGAFLSGFLLSASPFRHQLVGQLGPMRDLLIAIFFTAVGMNVDLGVLAEWWWAVGIGVVITLALKTGAISLAAWAFGASATTAVSVALALAQGGEFSLIVQSVASENGIIGDTAFANATAVVALSIVVTPSLISLAERVGPKLLAIPPAPWIATKPKTSPDAPEPDASQREGHVIIAGFGVVGRAVADELTICGVPYTIVELNPGTVRRQAELGRSVIYGDISNPDVLESAGLKNAAAVVLTAPDPDAVIRACQTIRGHRPDVFIAARTNFLSQGMIATTHGADLVTVEEMATAQAMATEVVGSLRKRAELENRPGEGEPQNP